MRRSKAAEKRNVVAVRIDPVIERRLRLLVEVSGRKSSFFLQQLIEGGMDALERAWLSPSLLEQVRAGTLPERTAAGAVRDLFDESAWQD